MNIFSPILEEDAAKADLIKQFSGSTYLCYMDKTAWDKSKPAESQAIWRIALYCEMISGDFTITKLLYPSGRKDFVFVPDLCDTYNYNYAY